MESIKEVIEYLQKVQSQKDKKNFSIVVSVLDEDDMEKSGMFTLSSDDENLAFNIHSMLECFENNPEMSMMLETHSLFKMTKGDIENIEELLKIIESVDLSN